jgi:hypothetical protein
MKPEVQAVRRAYQDVMEARAKSIVTEQLGRDVVGFMSVNHFEPDVAAEVFVLGPDGAPDGEPHEAEASG